MDEKIEVRLSDLAVILFNLMKGWRDRQIGSEDAMRTYYSIRNNIDLQTKIPVELMESALWTCTMLDERGKFEHPDQLSYEAFLKKLFFKTNKKLNKKYNYLESK